MRENNSGFKIDESQRQSWLSIAAVWAGGMICVPCLMIGGVLAGGGLSLGQIVLSILIGYGLICVYMICIGMQACQNGIPVKFFRTAALINQLSEAQENGSLSSLHKKLSRTDILILDEFGYVPYNRTGSQLLFDYLSEIHEKKVIILNTNLEFSRWVNVVYDEQMTATLVGRLMHHCHLLLFPGENNRLRESSINDLFAAQRGGGQNG